ncbi:centromere protein T isoform X3 [Talpa occidentalis]|uniref:centromere protein T isoform X3 n=1 Tax=Talpa occidentalis TaxID=50954 RepID=UPI00188F6AC4|nr:centromere protein T isoform X3 [Talpa occidentalis]
MADSYGSDSEPTTRTLLRHVLDTADPRTPRRRRSARARAHGAPPETPSFRRWSSQTKMTARQSSRRTRSTGRLTRTQASEHLEEQTPRTLLKNILLTAPESSIVIPEPKVKPVPAPQIVQPSRLESSRDSLELQLPELEPTTVLAPGLLAPGRKKQRLRLSVFQQGMDQEMPLSQEPRGNANASSLTSSLNLTFAIPLQPQSVQRPGLARRPLTRRAVDVGAFLQDLRDTSFALAPSAQLLAGKAEEADALAVNFPNTSSSVSDEDGVEPLQDGVGKEAEERMGEGLSLSKVKEATVAQESPGAEEHEGDTDMTELEGSWGAVEAKVPEECPGKEDTTGRTASPELVSGIIPEFLQTRQCQLLEQAAPPSPAVSSSEPQKPLSAKLPPRARVPRIRKDPHKTGLSHYAKLFSFYAKMPMEKKAFEMVEKCLDKYFEHLCDDLEVFAAHAGRKTVRPEDLELLMRRQGLVTNQVSLHVLVERHLPLEYRQLLIPCAFSGNAVFPAQ